jgi:hypothetical protein
VPSSKDWRKGGRNRAGHRSRRNKGASISMEDGQPWRGPAGLAEISTNDKNFRHQCGQGRGELGPAWASTA